MTQGASVLAGGYFGEPASKQRCWRRARRRLLTMPVVAPTEDVPVHKETTRMLPATAHGQEPGFGRRSRRATCIAPAPTDCGTVFAEAAYVLAPAADRGQLLPLSSGPCWWAIPQAGYGTIASQGADVMCPRANGLEPFAIGWTILVEGSLVSPTDDCAVLLQPAGGAAAAGDGCEICPCRWCRLTAFVRSPAHGRSVHSQPAGVCHTAAQGG